MRPRVAYLISGAGCAAAAAVVTVLAGPFVTGAPLVTALYGALFGAWTVGNALRGSFSYMRAERTPLSTRGRWIYGGIGALCVIGLPLILALAYEPPR